MDWEDKGCGFFAVFGKEMETFWGLFYRCLNSLTSYGIVYQLDMKNGGGK